MTPSSHVWQGQTCSRSPHGAGHHGGRARKNLEPPQTEQPWDEHHPCTPPDTDPCQDTLPAHAPSTGTGFEGSRGRIPLTFAGSSSSQVVDSSQDAPHGRLLLRGDAQGAHGSPELGEGHRGSLLVLRLQGDREGTVKPSGQQGTPRKSGPSGEATGRFLGCLEQAGCITLANKDV